MGRPSPPSSSAAGVNRALPPHTTPPADDLILRVPPVRDREQIPTLAPVRVRGPGVPPRLGAPPGSRGLDRPLARARQVPADQANVTPVPIAPAPIVPAPVVRVHVPQADPARAEVAVPAGVPRDVVGPWAASRRLRASFACGDSMAIATPSSLRTARWNGRKILRKFD